MTKKRILLVDDSSTVLMMEKMILSKHPYEILVAQNGAEAVKKAEADMPDAILMDVIMPQMNGLDACLQIKQRPSTAHIPIIMVTTRGEAVNVETGYANGCSDFVTKPINAMELVEKLQSVLAAVAPAAV